MEYRDSELKPDDDEEIPILDASMLHSSVDFEKGMSWWPRVTLTLIVACLVFFCFQAATNGLTDLNRMTDMGALSKPHVEQGEFWRLLSGPFLHATHDHLIGNLLMLFVLGMACEHAFGSSQFVFLYVVAALGGSCASLIHNSVSVGASGAIFGLAGALVGLFRRHQSSLHLRDRRIGFVIGFWVIYQIACGLLSPQIDNLAHVGGFCTGLLLGFVTPPALLNDRREFSRRPAVRLMLVMACAILVIASVSFFPRLIPT